MSKSHRGKRRSMLKGANKTTIVQNTRSRHILQCSISSLGLNLCYPFDLYPEPKLHYNPNQDH